MIEDILSGEVKEKDVIKSVEVVDFKKAFRNPDAIPEERKERLKDREFVLITTEKGCMESHLIPKGLKLEDGKWKVESKLELARSIKNPASWFRRYYNKYKKFPEEGDEIEVTINQRGFLRIDV